MDLQARKERMMYKDKLYSVGIIVWYGYGGGTKYGWWAKVEYEDFGHCDRGSVAGSIATKYADDIRYSINTIKADAEKLTIEFVETFPGPGPCLFYLQDGDSNDYPPPDGWRDLLEDEARRIGFHSIYKLGCEGIEDGMVEEETVKL
jgi:hypothetical protein